MVEPSIACLGPDFFRRRQFSKRIPMEPPEDLPSSGVEPCAAGCLGVSPAVDSHISPMPPLRVLPARCLDRGSPAFENDATGFSGAPYEACKFGILHLLRRVPHPSKDPDPYQYASHLSSRLPPSRPPFGFRRGLQPSTPSSPSDACVKLGKLFNL